MIGRSFQRSGFSYTKSFSAFQLGLEWAVKQFDQTFCHTEIMRLPSGEAHSDRTPGNAWEFSLLVEVSQYWKKTPNLCHRLSRIQ